MTQEEVDREFSNVTLQFHSYYKYTFTFAGLSEDGKSIEAHYGGNADDIYRHGFKAADGMPFVKCAEWKFVRVFDGSRVAFEWNDW